jgi:hypothetical protein
MAFSEGDLVKTLSQQILLGALLCSTFTSTIIARNTTAPDQAFETKASSDSRIDRQALVRRHNITLNKSNPLTPLSVGNGEHSYWAPEVIEHNGTYHMYLTFVPGIFADWSHPRDIIHLTSKDLLDWQFESTLKLSSNRVIDACVIRLSNSTWRMWYNNEVDRKSIYYADSPDLYKWQDRGKAMGERPGEGPKVFYWKNRYWMIIDIWQGLGVYYSDDCVTWTRQVKNLLEEPGKGPDDKVKGGHPDVVVSGDRAYLFYFTHPGRRIDNPKSDLYDQRRSSIQVVELKYMNGQITCNRDKPTYIRLHPIGKDS